MTDLQMAGHAKRTRAKLPHFDFVAMRPGRFVTSYDRWVGAQTVDAAFFLMPVAHPPEATRTFAVADWLLEETYPSGVTATEAVDPFEAARLQLRDLCARFLDEWLTATAHQASMRRAAKHPYFQLVREMRPIAVEMIIERLRDAPNPLWVWALGELTGEDPARGTDTIPDATDAWLHWADQRALG
jgi:hypothetical protein